MRQIDEVHVQVRDSAQSINLESKYGRLLIPPSFLHKNDYKCEIASNVNTIPIHIEERKSFLNRKAIAMQSCQE